MGNLKACQAAVADVLDVLAQPTAVVSQLQRGDDPQAQVTVVVPSVPFTAVWRYVVPTLVPSSTLVTACSSSGKSLASSERVIAEDAPFQM